MVDHSGWCPREERNAVEMAAQAFLRDGRMISVILTNSSGSGCEICSDETLRIGTKVTLKTVSGRQIDASVRWALPGRAGLRFAAEQP